MLFFTKYHHLTIQEMGGVGHQINVDRHKCPLYFNDGLHFRVYFYSILTGGNNSLNALQSNPHKHVSII
jgi:hypothetical protein